MFRDFRFLFASPVWIGLEESVEWNHCFRHNDHPGRRRRYGERMFGERWGDPDRTRRGDIKFLLLELLSEQPSHGYDLIKQMETRYSSFRRLSPGSVYPTLQLLEDGGYLLSEQREGKRIYTITDQGRQYLLERTQQEGADFPQDASKNLNRDKPQELSKLRQSATDVASAVFQVARSGDVERINRVRELLDQVKRDIYTILAEK